VGSSLAAREQSTFTLAACSRTSVPLS